jgi:hypothetical protein
MELMVICNWIWTITRGAIFLERDRDKEQFREKILDLVLDMWACGICLASPGEMMTG